MTCSQSDLTHNLMQAQMAVVAETRGLLCSPEFLYHTHGCVSAFIPIMDRISPA